jgi:hypothetical protein
MTIVSFGVDETGSVKRPSDARKQSKLSFSLLRLLLFSCEFDGSITGKTVLDHTERNRIRKSNT